MSLLAHTQKRYSSLQLNEDEQVNPLGSKRVRAVLAVSLLFVGTVAAVGAASARSLGAPADDVPLGASGPKATRDCSFVECESGGCNTDISPYLCLDTHGPLMGCSAEPWKAASCKTSCNMEACADASPSDDTKTCAGRACPSDVCDSYQQCGSAAPYQCIVGAANPGCSADAVRAPSWHFHRHHHHHCDRIERSASMLRI